MAHTFYRKWVEVHQSSVRILPWHLNKNNACFIARTNAWNIHLCTTWAWPPASGSLQSIRRKHSRLPYSTAVCLKSCSTCQCFQFERSKPNQSFAKIWTTSQQPSWFAAICQFVCSSNRSVQLRNRISLHWLWVTSRHPFQVPCCQEFSRRRMFWIRFSIDPY